MNLNNQIISFLKKRRDRILNGEINCIPLPFQRFQNELPGIEQGIYYLVSGATKSGKTQITNFLFVYNTILFAYKHPDILKPKIFYYNLEETDMAITLRFMSYLLYIKNGIVISPSNLKSTNNKKPLSQEIIDIIESKEFQDIMNFYYETVEFKDSRNPTGIYKDLKNYADNNGKTVKTKYTYKDELGIEKTGEKFAYYEPNNPNEYVFAIIDHVGLIETERGLDLRQCINKLSEYMIIFRNRYKYIPVIVQQQNIETFGLEAFKANKIRATIAGLGDSKSTGKDCSIMLGITNPFSFGMPEYLGYDITKLKDTFRCLEIVVNREGRSNGICPLYFNGAINYYAELPKNTDLIGMNKVYNLIDKLKKSMSLLMLSIKNKKYD